MRIYRERGLAGRDGPSRRSDRDHGRQQPPRAGGRRGAAARSQERRADGRGRDASSIPRRPGSSRTSPIGADTMLHPGVYLAGPHHASARAASSTSNVRVVDSTLDDDVVVNSFCVITESRVRAGAQARPVRAPPAAVGRRRAGARRQLRRAEEDDARAAARRRTTWRISATRRSARRSTSAPARSPATTTA